MSTEDHNANGERATVALVNAKVATVDVKVDGLAELIRTEFKDIQRQLGPIEALSAQITGLHERQLMYESRVHSLEEWRTDTRATTAERRKYRWTDLPQILTGLGLFALAAAQYIHH